MLNFSTLISSPDYNYGYIEEPLKEGEDGNILTPVTGTFNGGKDVALRLKSNILKGGLAYQVIHLISPTTYQAF